MSKRMGFAAGEVWVSRGLSDGEAASMVRVDYEAKPEKLNWGEDVPNMNTDWLSESFVYKGQQHDRMPYRDWKKMTGIEVKGGQCLRVQIPRGEWVALEDVSGE